MPDVNKAEVEAYKDKARARLDQVNADIAKLRARVDEASADARAEGAKQLQEAEKKKEQIEEQLGQLSSAAQDSWDELTSGLDRSLEDVKQAVAGARETFKSKS